MPYLVDSDVLIDVYRGNVRAREYVDALPEAWGLSQVSALELIVGARNKEELARTDKFLSDYVVLPLQAAIGLRAYELLKKYAKSHGLHVFDSLIAATALDENLILVTRNRKHFAMIEGLSLDVPAY
jgi:predicted nucleic acid-binding protein